MQDLQELKGLKVAEER
jgi:hypothetical protein